MGVMNQGKESIMTNMTNKNNKELVNKLSNIIKGYDPYTAYIEDYKQYSNAVDNNCKLDQQFIHTCNEYGYNVGVSFCYSLAKSLASGKFDSAEETVVDYINSLTKEDDSILSSPNKTLENNDNANKEEIAMKKNNNTPETINNATTVEVEKEESTMKNNNTTATNNSTTTKKEEMTMEALVKRLTENRKVQDKGYIDRPTLKKILNEKFGFHFNSRSTRTEMIEALMNKYKDSLRVTDETAYENEDNSVKEEITTEKTEDIPATHQVICIDHAYYDDEFVAFAGTQEECNDYINRHFTEEDARLGLFSYTIHPVPIDIPVGDLSITSDRIYYDDTIIEKTVPVKVNNPAPVPVYDAKTLTYRLMHKIGDHALSNRKKGFGTTISAKILCAFIVEVASLNDPEPIDKLYVPTGKKDKYGKDITMVNPKVTEEHRNKCKDVRNWLLDKGYIKPVTFKDEKGFTFYTPEYDGNRKDKMYDATKFQATGKVETTTYRVTKEMNKWYV